MSEILQLTKKIDDFILTIGTKVGAHDEAIIGCKENRDIVNETLFDKKNGMTVKMKGIETILKGKQSSFGNILQFLTALFMGGIFILWIIKTINQL